MSHGKRTVSWGRSSAVMAAAVMGISLFTHAASAADSTWSGGGSDANWSTAANWDVTPVAGSGLIFSGPGQTSPNNDFAAATTFDRLEFSTTAANFTVGGNAVQLNNGIISNSTGVQFVNLAVGLTASETFNIASGSLTVGGNITELSGGTSLTKTGGGLLVLTGTNVWTGKTNINGGTLQADGTSLPAGNVAFNGGILQTTSGSITGSLGTGSGQYDLTNSGGFSAASTALNVNLGGAGATLAWGSTPNFNPATLYLNGSAANNTLTLANALDLRGATRTISAGANVANLTSVVDTVGGGGITKSGSGTLVLNGIAFTGPIATTAGTLVANVSAGTYANSMPTTGGNITFNVPTGNTTFSGDISGNANITFPFTTPQTATISLTGNNTMANNTVTLSNGVFVVNADTTFGGTGTMVVNASATTGQSVQLLNQGAAHTIARNLSLGGAQANPLGLTIRGDQSLTFSGSFQATAANVYIINEITGGGSLTFSGPFNMSNSTSARTIRFGGQGITVISGAITDAGTNSTTTNSVLFKGASSTSTNTGTLIINTNSVGYHGGGTIGLGTVVFNGGLPSATNTGGSNVYLRVDTLGAIAYAGGIQDPTFVSRLGAVAGSASASSTGSLAILSNADAAANVNFSAAGTGWNSMGLGAALGAYTYTGTLTPLPNSWKLGGGNGTLTFPQAIVDTNSPTASNLTVLGGANGVLILTNPGNTYTGSTTVNLYQTLKNGVDNAVSTATTTLTVGNGSVNLDSAVYDLNGFNQSVRNLAGTGKITSTAGTPTLTVNPTTSSSSNSFTGIVTGSLGFTQNGAGTMTLGGVNTYSGKTSVTGAGMLVMNGSSNSIGQITGTGRMELGTPAGANPIAMTSDGITIASLALNQNTTATVRTNGGAVGASKISTLTLSGGTGAWTSKLDLKNNALIIQSADLAGKSAVFNTTKDQILSGKNGGTWDGNGITSSSIPGNPNATLALVDGADLPGTFRGQTVDANSVLVVEANLGDVNLDGNVDLADYDKWYKHVGTGTPFSYAAGDINMDGNVDLADYDLWYKHVGVAPLTLASAALGGGVSAVPEPASLAVLAVGSAALLGRRRRK